MQEQKPKNAIVQKKCFVSKSGKQKQTTSISLGPVIIKLMLDQAHIIMLMMVMMKILMMKMLMLKEKSLVSLEQSRWIVRPRAVI